MAQASHSGKVFYRKSISRNATHPQS